jgi:hypothetical protein
MANKYMKKISISLAIRGIQVKTISNFHFTPVRIALFKDKQQMLARIWEKGMLTHCWWECKLV